MKYYMAGELNRVQLVTDVHPNFIKANGNASVAIKASDTIIAEVFGDLSQDQKTLTVKTLRATQPDGSQYAVVDQAEKPFAVALDENGQIDLTNSSLKAQLAHLEKDVAETIAPSLHQVAINPDKKSFTYEVGSSPTKESDPTSYEIYHGTIGENGKATITHIELLDQNRNAMDGIGKLQLQQPLTVETQNNAINISEQQLWELSAQGHDQRKKLMEEQSQTPGEAKPQNFFEVIINAIIGLFTGMFGGGENSNAQESPPAQTMPDGAKQYVATTVGNLQKLTNEKGEYSPDINRDGKFDIKDVVTINNGQNPDKDGDGKLNKEESGALLNNLDAIAKMHPEIKEIAANFKKSLEGLNIEGHNNTSLPNTGKGAAVEI